MGGMSGTLAIGDERGVREVVEIERERQEHDRRDDDPYDDRVRATKAGVRHHERGRDRGQDRNLGHPMQRVGTVDHKGVDHRAIEEPGREADDREDAGVAYRVAEREQEPQTEREKNGGNHPFVDPVVRREKERRRKCDREDHRKDEQRRADDPYRAIADPLTSFVLRNAAEVTFLVAATFFMYHLFVVADAFAGKLRGMGSLRGRHIVDYLALGLVCMALVAFYATAYRGSAPWAGLATKIFAPLANPPTVSASSGQDPSPPAWTGTERLNVLLLGIDSRGDSTTQNTDTMIVLSLDPVNKTAAMLSIPRDVYIDRPGVFTDKINAAFAYGGYDLTRKVVEDLLGIRLNAYALVDFDAFTKIVDAVGGVVIDVKRPVRDESYPTPDYGVERLDITAGPQLMDCQTEFRFARARHDTNDYSRAQRPQLVLSAMRTRISEGDFLRGLPGLIDRVGSAVQTTFDPANLLPLARFGSVLD